MPKQIKYMDSKAERKRERQRIGRLSDQRVTQGTKERYQHSLKEVAEFAGVSTDRLLSTPGLDGILSDYIERLWKTEIQSLWPAMHWLPYSFTSLL